ncbi:HEPN domain-containing protein [Salinibacter ruber]|uniref:HEPN domain-containing protein n=1 Tax=Salinibacter ruber TaxID=146919 RepID=UPI002167257C|nr:HEPN domain-containing protein [Salinibacter ruber]
MKARRCTVPHEKQRRPDDPQAWLDRACSNLIRSRQRMPDVYLEDLCFDAQQAAEKALKALCIERGIDFPYVHDMARLVTLLQDEGQPVPDAVREAGRLTRYAVLTRYPGLDDPVNEDDYERAVEIAERVVEWVEGHVETGGETPDS